MMLAVDLGDPARRRPRLRRNPLARCCRNRFIQQPLHRGSRLAAHHLPNIRGVQAIPFDHLGEIVPRG
jgi:hypothetical protein